MAEFFDDETIRMQRVATQNANSDVAFLKLENPGISPGEESDTWRSLYTFHLKKLKGEYPFDGDQRRSIQWDELE